MSINIAAALTWALGSMGCTGGGTTADTGIITGADTGTTTGDDAGTDATSTADAPMSTGLVGTWRNSSPSLLQDWIFNADMTYVSRLTTDFPADAVRNAGCHNVTTDTGLTWSATATMLMITGGSTSETIVQTACATPADNSNMMGTNSSGATNAGYTITGNMLMVTESGLTITFTRVP